MADEKSTLKLSVSEFEHNSKLALKPLFEGSDARVAVLDLSDDLKRILTIARRARQMLGGLEAIEEHLKREEKGIASLRTTQPGQRQPRITRVLFLTSDGSERFFRMSETILKKYGHRVLGIRLNALGSEVGSQYFGQDAEVKAVMLKHKSAVEAFLRLVVPAANNAAVKTSQAFPKQPKKK